MSELNPSESDSRHIGAAVLLIVHTEQMLPLFLQKVCKDSQPDIGVIKYSTLRCENGSQAEEPRVTLFGDK